ncbi:MAG: hypothetical protein AAGI10_07735 [Pseudomonadota bacterium]
MKKSDIGLFAQYIMYHAQAGDNPNGDFIRDARMQIELGKFWPDGQELDGIKRIQHGPAREAGLRVHKNFRVWMRKTYKRLA